MMDRDRYFLGSKFFSTSKFFDDDDDIFSRWKVPGNFSMVQHGTGAVPCCTYETRQGTGAVPAETREGTGAVPPQPEEGTGAVPPRPAKGQVLYLRKQRRCRGYTSKQFG